MVSPVTVPAGFPSTIDVACPFAVVAARNVIGATGGQLTDNCRLLGGSNFAASKRLPALAVVDVNAASEPPTSPRRRRLLRSRCRATPPGDADSGAPW